MNRQAQVLTGIIVLLCLGVVATLVVTGTAPTGADQASPGPAASSSPAPSATSSPPAATRPGDRPSGSGRPEVPASPRVRLPEPSDQTDPAEAAASAERRAQREAKRRAMLVPEVPEVATGSLECIEAIAQRRTLRAVTFNIHGGFGGGGLNLDDIGREIAAMDADVVLLQEVDRGRKRTRRQDQAALLGTRLGMDVAYDANSGRRTGGTIGNAVLSRFPITSVRRAPLPKGGAERRGVMRVTVDIDNVELAVYVTHLEHTSQGVRRRQMQYIAGALRAEPLPLLVGGDLNARPGSSVLGIARGVVGDAWPAAGRGVARTTSRSRIDYLLHGPTVRPLRAQVVGSRISDHNAVLGGFEIGPPEACQQG